MDFVLQVVANKCFFLFMVRWRFLIWSLSFWDLSRERIFSVNLYKKIGSVCFSDSFVQKNVSNQMATVMIQATPSFLQTFQKTTSLILQRHMDHTLYVTTTSLLTIKTSCEFYSMACIATNYLEKLMSCYKNWMLSIPHPTTWMSLYAIRVPIKPENFCREGTCNW